MNENLWQYRVKWLDRNRCYGFLENIRTGELVFVHIETFRRMLVKARQGE